MMRTGECVLNLPSIGQVRAVDNIARTTGSNPVPQGKQSRGYVYEPDKFGRSGLTPIGSDVVAPPRALECPVQMEAVVMAAHGIGEDTDELRGRLTLIETRIKRVHVHPDLLMEGHENRIDPDKWSPLIMSFQKFYGLSEQVHPSRLADIPERLYRSPDVERARREAEAGGA
jgi:flavin reductase (DIM6/NTAB) family NADH-FMN oxidoreductase RutF